MEGTLNTIAELVWGELREGKGLPRRIFRHSGGGEKKSLLHKRGGWRCGGSESGSGGTEDQWRWRGRFYILKNSRKRTRKGERERRRRYRSSRPAGGGRFDRRLKRTRDAEKGHSLAEGGQKNGGARLFLLVVLGRDILLPKWVLVQWRIKTEEIKRKGTRSYQKVGLFLLVSRGRLREMEE